MELQKAIKLSNKDKYEALLRAKEYFIQGWANHGYFSAVHNGFYAEKYDNLKCLCWSIVYGLDLTVQFPNEILSNATSSDPDSDLSKNKKSVEEIIELSYENVELVYPEFIDICKRNGASFTDSFYWTRDNFKHRINTLNDLINIYKNKI